MPTTSNGEETPLRCQRTTSLRVRDTGYGTATGYAPFSKTWTLYPELLHHTAESPLDTFALPTHCLYTSYRHRIWNCYWLCTVQQNLDTQRTAFPWARAPDMVQLLAMHRSAKLGHSTQCLSTGADTGYGTATSYAPFSKTCTLDTKLFQHNPVLLYKLSSWLSTVNAV